jgi:glycosyltransferase involved in cell wall biosynthesis
VNADWPLLSIVTPSYNQGPFLEAAIRSVLDQDYPRLEYLVIDGGSTDGSVDIIHNYADRLAWWVSERDRGQASAVNRGLARATGDIIGWLNSDDVYLPGCFDAVVDAFRRNPSVDVVYGDFDYIDRDGNLLLHKKEIPIDLSIMLFGRSHVCQPTVFLRRSVIECVGPLDERLHYSLDWDWFWRIGTAGHTFHQVRRPLAGYRWQADSKSVSNRAAALHERRQLQLDYLAREWKLTSPWTARAVLFVLDKWHRGKWHLAKFIKRGQLDFVTQRIRLRRSKYR